MSSYPLWANIMVKHRSRTLSLQYNTSLWILARIDFSTVVQKELPRKILEWESTERPKFCTRELQENSVSWDFIYQSTYLRIHWQSLNARFTALHRNRSPVLSTIQIIKESTWKEQSNLQVYFDEKFSIKFKPYKRIDTECWTHFSRCRGLWYGIAID